MIKELEAVKEFFAGLTISDYRQYRRAETVLGTASMDEHGFSLYCIEVLGGTRELKAVLLALEKEKPAMGIKPIIDLANERAKEVFKERREKREGRIVRWIKRKPALLFSHLKNLLSSFNKEDYRGRSAGAFKSFLVGIMKEQGYFDLANKAGIPREELEALAVERAGVVYHSGNGAQIVYSAKDNISNKLWDGKIKPNTIIPVKADQKGAFGSVVQFMVNEVTKVQVVHQGYGDYERSVHDAISSLWAKKPADKESILVSSLEIYRTITQNSKAKLTEAMAKEIERAMLNCGRGEMTIVTDPAGDRELWERVTSIRKLKPEREKYKNLMSKYYGRLITFDAESSGEFGGTLDRWTIFRCPVLYDYAHTKEQVASISLQLTGKQETRRGKGIIAVSSYLDRRIETMKKNKNMRRSILWENLYELDNSTTSNKDTKNPKQSQWVMQQRTRAKVIKLLDERIKAGEIKGYSYKDKGNMQQVGKRWKYHAITIIF